jgi:hypothetical protein
VLAQLDQVESVQGSYSNESNSMIMLDVLPTADYEKVARVAQRILKERIGDCCPVRASEETAATAAPKEEWHDRTGAASVPSSLEEEDNSNPIGESDAAQAAAAGSSGLSGLILLLLACLAIGLGIFWWRRMAKPMEDDYEEADLDPLSVTQ